MHDQKPATEGVDPVAAAAKRLYQAEITLRDAHLSRVDSWIEAAHASLLRAARQYVVAKNTAITTSPVEPRTRPKPKSVPVTPPA